MCGATVKNIVKVHCNPAADNTELTGLGHSDANIEWSSDEDL